MKDLFGNAEEILDRRISGFHQYRLSDPVRLIFVSQNFCEMFGFTKEELISDHTDLYVNLVHPADRELYKDFILVLAKEEQTLNAQYRIIRKDGGIRYVNDTVTSRRLPDGTMVGDSVLSDITSVKAENGNLQFLNETIPCAFLRYTCEKQPKITYLNEHARKILRIPEEQDGEFDYLEMYRENIYLMIPMEERKRFSGFLNRVYRQGAPVAGEMTVLRCDGSRARLFGWVAKSVNGEGLEEFQSVCMDITERYKTARVSATERYLSALTEVYDKIFEYDLANRTVKCLYGQNSDVFKWLKNIPMHLTEAMEQWISSAVLEEDRGAVREFFGSLLGQNLRSADDRPPQIRYRALSSEGDIKTYRGILLQMDASVSLFCCRRISKEEETDSLRSENDSLRSMNENMQELVMRFTDGIVAFEVEEDRVKPLYASDNVCEFFGYTKEEWIRMAGEGPSIKEFVSKSSIDYTEVKELFEKGEAEFDYIDLKSQTSRRIKAVCSRMFSDDASRQYVMLYNVDAKNRQDKTEAERGQIYIRTFGYFDVFVDEKPIAFRNKKSKELFALLVDRRGGYVSSEEAISFLWEEEPVNAVTLARYRKVALRLKNILEEYGIADIVESVDGKRRIVAEQVRCDLYDYLTRKEEYAQLFKGSYLTNYSWGETTLGELLGEHLL